MATIEEILQTYQDASTPEREHIIEVAGRTRMWKPGDFAADVEKWRKGRTFEQLELTPGERAILTELIRNLNIWKSGSNGLGAPFSLEVLAEIRGMKRAFDLMRTSEDAYSESLLWQSHLY